jgi:prevent-host-death family protein
MRIASIASVKARLSAYVEESADAPVVVTRNGKAVAVLVGVEDDDEVERLLLAHSKKLRKILDDAERRIQEGRGIEHDEFWRQVEERNARKAAKPVKKKVASKHRS